MMRAASASLRLFSALRRSSSSASATALQAVRRRQSRGTSSLDGGREPRGAGAGTGAGAGAGRRGRRVDMAAARCAAAISRATFSGSSDLRRSASRRARFSGLPFHIGGLATTAPGRSSGKGFLPASGSPFLGRAKVPWFGALSKMGTPLMVPSFLPMGSSRWTPTQTPGGMPSTAPTNLTTPRRAPGLTSQRPPNTTWAASASVGTSAGSAAVLALAKFAVPLGLGGFQFGSAAFCSLIHSRTVPLRAS